MTQSALTILNLSDLLTLSRGGPELTIQGGGKNACATYFGHISSMEARIFMKFETYVHKIVLDHQPNFHKDPCKDARARGENVCTCEALQRFRSESTKIKKMRFSASYDDYSWQNLTKKMSAGVFAPPLNRVNKLGMRFVKLRASLDLFAID